MPAYMIAHIDVLDLELFERYAEVVAPIVASFGGRYLVRGGAILALEGEPKTDRVVIIEFPDIQAAQAFHTSPAYQPVLAMRKEAATSTVVVLLGI